MNTMTHAYLRMYMRAEHHGTLWLRMVYPKLHWWETPSWRLTFICVRTYSTYRQSLYIRTFVYYLTHWVGKLSYSSTALLLTIEHTWASVWCVHITELVAKYSAVCEALRGLPSMAFFWYVSETAVPISLLSVRTLPRQWLPTHCCTCVRLCTRLPAGHLGVSVGRMVWCPGNGLPTDAVSLFSATHPTNMR